MYLYNDNEYIHALVSTSQVSLLLDYTIWMNKWNLCKGHKKAINKQTS